MPRDLVCNFWKGQENVQLLGRWQWEWWCRLNTFFFFYFILFLNFTILYWFCQISKWIRHSYTCVPHPEPSSLFPPHTIPLGEHVQIAGIGLDQAYQHNQFSSVAQSCPTLCNPMNHSMPGLPVHHQLPEFTQTHVHRVGCAIQPSHPLSSPSPPAPNPSQHQSLFQWVNSSHEVAKVLEFQL